MEQMDLKEITLERRDIFTGRIVSLHVDKVRLPDGKTSTREVVEHVGGVGILALDEEKNALMVTQYRYVFGKPLMEIPAGKLDPGEDPETGALRELREETGAIPDKLISLGAIFASPGCFSEVLHLFLAQDLRIENQHLDPGEFLKLERVPFSDLVQRCLDGEIEDAKTVAAVLKAKIRFQL